MICPHCCSPRHFLCAAGFRVSVNISTMAGDADECIQTLAHSAKQRHLLGPTTKAAPAAPAAPQQTESGATAGETSSEPTSILAQAEALTLGSTLVVLPVFSDTGLGSFGLALIQTQAPQLLDNGSLTIAPETGKTALVQLYSPDAPLGNILLIGLGTESLCQRTGLCGLVGSAIDQAVAGGYTHLVVALADFSETHLDGRQIGAVARCRLSVAVVEDEVDRTLNEMTLVVKPQQVETICQGIEVPGMLCASCSHPQATTQR